MHTSPIPKFYTLTLSCNSMLDQERMDILEWSFPPQLLPYTILFSLQELNGKGQDPVKCEDTYKTLKWFLTLRSGIKYPVKQNKCYAIFQDFFSPKTFIFNIFKYCFFLYSSPLPPTHPIGSHVFDLLVLENNSLITSYFSYNVCILDSRHSY